MIGFFKSLFGNKQAETKVEEAPYKVEAKPVEDLADIAIAQRPTPIAQQATEAMVESVKPAPAKKARAKKPATAKKPRKPKQPKQS